MGVPPDLPFVDEHEVLVAADAAEVWRALGRSLSRAGRHRRGMGLLAPKPGTAVGDPLVAGSTIPGFAVTETVESRELLLTGRHRFSRYALLFTLEVQEQGTRLRARTHALFPGARGAAYRACVVGTGAHRLVVRRWLRHIAAESIAGAAAAP